MINKVKILLLDDHKREILRGSFETILIKIAGLLVGLVFIATLSNKYGAEAVGIYQIAVQFILVISMISLLGFNQAIILFSAQLASKKHISELKKVVINYSLITFAFSVLISLLVAIFSKELASSLLKDDQLSGIFIFISFSIPIYALNLLYVEFIRGLKKIKLSEFLRVFFIRFLNLVLFLLLVTFFNYNVYWPVITYEVAILVTFLFSLFYVVSAINLKKVENVVDIGTKKNKYFSTSFTMYQSILLMLMSSNVAVFVLAYYSNPAEVGIYNIAFQLAALTTFVFSAVTTILAPKFSELHLNNINEFKKTVRFSSKIIFWTTGTISIITIVLSGWLMRLFGNEFDSGQMILVVLSLANLINSMTGPSGVLLDMVGRQHIRRNILLISTIITLILAFILINRFGAIGLAYALLVDSIICNCIGVVYVKKELGINLIYIPLLTK